MYLPAGQGSRMFIHVSFSKNCSSLHAVQSVLEFSHSAHTPLHTRHRLKDSTERPETWCVTIRNNASYRIT